jgi:hypothetical protein
MEHDSMDGGGRIASGTAIELPGTATEGNSERRCGFRRYDESFFNSLPDHCSFISSTELTGMHRQRATV